MNRAERRRRERESAKQINRPATYNYTSEQINSIKQAAYNQGKHDGITSVREELYDRVRAEAMSILFSISVKVMREKYRWGKHKRLPEFAEALADTYNGFRFGDDSPKEMQEYVYKETGLKFYREEVKE